jgi:tRNA A-37 threonylcarbamoyl transferase component Bud32
LAGAVELAGRRLDVVVKRPRRRYWYRYLNEIGRGARARRAWVKSWKMISRNVPCAWPLLMMERRRLGYVVDTMIVLERVPGPTLAKVDLDAITSLRRDMLLRRVGRILRRIEQLGFSHFDAKASNWIVRPDDRRGETPVLVDIDGIRQRTWVALGIERLLKSMRKHPQYTPADSLALCQGYAPFTRIERERDAPHEEADETADKPGDAVPSPPEAG